MAEFPQSLVDTIKAHDESEPEAGASDAQIATAQAAAGFSFPPSYAQFLSHFNGGEFGYYLMFGADCADSEDALDIVEQAEAMSPYIEGLKQGHVYPFGKNWGGSYLCFDLREKSADGEYPVLYWNHESSEDSEDSEYDDEGDEVDPLWSRFADTFAEFMQRHYDNID